MNYHILNLNFDFNKDSMKFKKLILANDETIIKALNQAIITYSSKELENLLSLLEESLQEATSEASRKCISDLIKKLKMTLAEPEASSSSSAEAKEQADPAIANVTSSPIGSTWTQTLARSTTVNPSESGTKRSESSNSQEFNSDLQLSNEIHFDDVPSSDEEEDCFIINNYGH